MVAEALSIIPLGSFDLFLNVFRFVCSWLCVPLKVVCQDSSQESLEFPLKSWMSPTHKSQSLLLDILSSDEWRNMVYYWISWLYIEIHVYEGNELTVELVLSIYGSVGGLITQKWSEFSWGSSTCQNTLTSAQRYSVLIGRSPIQRYSCVRLGTKPTEGRNEKQHVYPFCARNFGSEKSLFGSLLRDN